MGRAPNLIAMIPRDCNRRKRSRDGALGHTGRVAPVPNGHLTVFGEVEFKIDEIPYHLTTTFLEPATPAGVDHQAAAHWLAVGRVIALLSDDSCSHEALGNGMTVWQAHLCSVEFCRPPTSGKGCYVWFARRRSLRRRSKGNESFLYYWSRSTTSDVGIFQSAISLPGR
jgi:hypothetical protein